MKQEESKGKWDAMCKCGHWFHEHYDYGLNREGSSFGDCLHEDNDIFCKCNAFEEKK